MIIKSKRNEKDTIVGIKTNRYVFKKCMVNKLFHNVSSLLSVNFMQTNLISSISGMRFETKLIKFHTVNAIQMVLIFIFNFFHRFHTHTHTRDYVIIAIKKENILVRYVQ